MQCWGTLAGAPQDLSFPVLQAEMVWHFARMIAFCLWDCKRIAWDLTQSWPVEQQPHSAPAGAKGAMDLLSLGTPALNPFSRIPKISPQNRKWRGGQYHGGESFGSVEENRFARQSFQIEFLASPGKGEKNSWLKLGELPSVSRPSSSRLLTKVWPKVRQLPIFLAQRYEDIVLPFPHDDWILFHIKEQQPGRFQGLPKKHAMPLKNRTKTCTRKDKYSSSKCEMPVLKDSHSQSFCPSRTRVLSCSGYKQGH